jgi:hypothetical protein
MSIDRSGAPFIGVAALIALALAFAGQTLIALPFFVLALFFVYFFRDPDRHSQAGPEEIVSPADGACSWRAAGRPARRRAHGGRSASFSPWTSTSTASRLAAG